MTISKLHNLPRADRLALMRILTRAGTKNADNLMCIFGQPGEAEAVELAAREGKLQKVEWTHKAIRPAKPKLSVFATGEDVLDFLGVGKPRRPAVSVIGRSVPMSEEEANRGASE